MSEGQLKEKLKYLAHDSDDWDAEDKLNKILDEAKAEFHNFSNYSYNDLRTWDADAIRAWFEKWFGAP